MANEIDEVEEEEDLEETEEEDVEEEEEESDEEEIEEEDSDEDDENDIPEKFKGKSKKEIIESYKALEKVLGLPAEKRKEKVVEIADDSDIDVDVPDNTSMVQEYALSNLALFNESLDLGLEFNAEGYATNFDPKNKEHERVWNRAVKQAEKTVALIDMQIAPIRNAVTQKSITKEIIRFASDIEGTDPEAVAKSFNINPAEWKGYSEETKKFLITDRAKAIAYDLSKNNVKKDKTGPKTQPVTKDIVSKTTQKQNHGFMKAFNEVKLQYAEQLENGVLTEDDIKDIVKATRS